jgi:hypothetical protein
MSADGIVLQVVRHTQMHDGRRRDREVIHYGIWKNFTVL